MLYVSLFHLFLSLFLFTCRLANNGMPIHNGHKYPSCRLYYKYIIGVRTTYLSTLVRRQTFCNGSWRWRGTVVEYTQAATQHRPGVDTSSAALCDTLLFIKINEALTAVKDPIDLGLKVHNVLANAHGRLYLILNI